MFVSKTYRNNFGYQIHSNRPKPMEIWNMTRYSSNRYTTLNRNVQMAYNIGSTHGLQYGGGTSPELQYDAGSQKGKGFVDNAEAIMATVSLLKAAGSAVKSAYVSDTGTKIRNKYGKFMNKENSKWRPGFAGEMHMINSSDGTSMNFCGPGTNVPARLARGDQGVSELDEICKVHDIDYYKARDWNAVRLADEKFVKNIDNSNIGYVKKKVMKGLMKGKILGEKVGAFGKEQFTSFPDIQDKPEFIGKGDKIFPSKGDPTKKLKNKVKKYKKKNTDKLLIDALKFIKKR